MRTEKREVVVCRVFFAVLFSLIVVTMFDKFQVIDVMFLAVILFYVIKYCYLIIKD